MYHNSIHSSLLSFATGADVLPQVSPAASAALMMPLLSCMHASVGLSCAHMRKHMIHGCRCEILVTGMRQRVTVKQTKVRTQMQKTGKHTKL